MPQTVVQMIPRTVPSLLSRNGDVAAIVVKNSQHQLVAADMIRQSAQQLRNANAADASRARQILVRLFVYDKRQIAHVAHFPMAAPAALP